MVHLGAPLAHPINPTSIAKASRQGLQYSERPCVFLIAMQFDLDSCLVPDVVLCIEGRTPYRFLMSPCRLVPNTHPWLELHIHQITPSAPSV